jgi:hypothetical protein
MRLMGKLTKTRFVIDVEYAGNPKDFYKLFQHRTGYWPHKSKSHVKGNAVVVESNSTTTKVPIQTKQKFSTERSMIRSLIMSALPLAKFEVVKPKMWYQHGKIYDYSRANSSDRLACVTSRCSRVTGDKLMFAVQLWVKRQYDVKRGVIYMSYNPDDQRLYLGQVMGDPVTPVTLYNPSNTVDPAHSTTFERVVSIADPDSAAQLSELFLAAAMKLAGDSKLGGVNQ